MLGLKFKNGDYQSLYKCMIKLLTDESLAKQQLENASLQVKLFNEINLTKKYIDIYQSLLNHKPIQSII
jgi:glycosyltransferase involved in cell wall biosynthesis